MRSERLSLTICGCPYCGNSSPEKVVHRLRYSETIMAVPGIEDFEGWVEECADCGVFFVSPRYAEEDLEKIYPKLTIKGKGAPLAKWVASLPISMAIHGWHSPNPLRRALARFIDDTLGAVLFVPIPSHPVRGGRVLDVGCGNGFHLRCYARLGFEAFGTEIHSGYAPFLSQGPERIRYWLEEFTRIDWEREVGWGTFGLILFQGVFYRLNNPKPSLELAWRLLKPGGSIIRIEPFCPDPDAVRFITRFNFPQGTSFIRDIEVYSRRLSSFLPGAEFSHRIYYGRCVEHAGGKLTMTTALWDALTRFMKSGLRSEPWYIRFEIRKPLQGPGTGS